MPSAINSESRNILPGAAVAVGNGFARLASPELQATAIAMDGAPPHGVVTISLGGTVELNNWGLVTPNRFLETGKEYFVSDNGKLTTARGTQSIGIAVSLTELQVIISPQPEAAPYVPVVPAPTPEELFAQDHAVFSEAVITGVGPPTAGVGKLGQVYIDTSVNRLYLPKTASGWPTPPLNFAS